MKLILLIVPCLLFVGCGKQDEAGREALSKLDGLKAQLETIKTDLTAHQSQPIRWATANKRQIESAIYEWVRVKSDEAKQKETLTTKQQEDLHQFEVLQAKLSRQNQWPRMINPQTGLPMHANGEQDQDYKALSEQIEQARLLVSDILERRSRIDEQYRNQFQPEQLITEYVKDRFDLVVDSSEASFNRSCVLYSHSGEALDITEGVIKLFKDKTAK